jgi:hypothetical protein
MSDFNHHIATDLPHDFYYMDIDGTSYKRETKILRIMESKRESERVTDGQKLQLPLYATMIELMVQHGHVDPQSGVLLVRNIANDYSEATICRVLPYVAEWRLSKPVYATGDLLHRLEGSKPVADDVWTRLSSEA